MLIDTEFKTTSSRKRILEVKLEVTKLGLQFSDVLIRVFSANFEQNVRKYGTDRAGIDKSDTRRTKWDLLRGENSRYEILKKKGLKLEDGIYLAHLQSGVDQFLKRNILFNGRYGVSIYHSSAIELLVWDYCCFKNPDKKLDALIGIIMEPKN
jgi:hypothetical protein